MKKEDFDIDDKDYNPYELDDEEQEIAEELYSDKKKKKEEIKEEPETEEEEHRRKIVLILLFIILLILGGFIYFKFLRGLFHGGYIVAFEDEAVTVKENETKAIKYAIYDENPTESISFNSDNENIATVDDDGNVTGIKVGETTVNIIYIDYNDNPYVDTLVVTVVPGDKIPTPKPPTPPKEEDITKPVIALKVIEGKLDNWNLNNVKVQVLVTDKYGIKSIKYSINDSGYQTINNKDIITLSNNGANKLMVIATNTKGKQSSKSTTIYIDKVPPKVELIPNNTEFTASDTVQVCAKCTDSESGCVSNQTCKTYNTSATNVIIEVSDKAGNKTKSNPFKITISKPEPQPEKPTPPPEEPTPPPEEPTKTYGPHKSCGCKTYKTKTETVWTTIGTQSNCGNAGSGQTGNYKVYYTKAKDSYCNNICKGNCYKKVTQQKSTKTVTTSECATYKSCYHD